MLKSSIQTVIETLTNKNGNFDITHVLKRMRRNLVNALLRIRVLLALLACLIEPDRYEPVADVSANMPPI